MPEVVLPERQSLLGTGHVNGNPSICNDETSQNDVQAVRRNKSSTTSTPTRVILYFMAVHFLLAFCEIILVAPLIRLFEWSLCISYYELHDPRIIIAGKEIPEFRCKIPGV